MKEKLNKESISWGDLAPKGLPNKVIYCKKCVISNQKPITSLESLHTRSHKKETVRFTNGICDACRFSVAKEMEINWEKREEELINLLDKYRSKKGEYDVIVPVSGGKDSCYVAHILKTKYNMNPLTVTWKPHEFTNVGFKNLMNLINSGQSNVLVSPPGNVHRKLTQLAFKNIGHPFQPFIVGQRSVGPKLAIKEKVKLIFYGENVAEYGNKIEENYNPQMNPKLYTCYDFNNKNLNSYKIAGLSISELINIYGFKFNDLLQYQSPSLNEIRNAKIQVHYMSYYRKWIPQDNYYYAVQNTGFQPNELRTNGTFSKYAGIDDVMEELHYYMQFIKFGMGRCTWDASQEVRTGKLTRDEAVALVKKFDSESPSQNLNIILEYLELTENEFWSIVNSFRPKHLWSYNKNKFYLINEIS